MRPTRFENMSERPLALYLEPWGMDYWLLTGDIFDVVPDSDAAADFHLHVVHSGDAIQVYVEGTGGATVCRDGAELPCGFQRPDPS